jgi:glycosidase
LYPHPDFLVPFFANHDVPRFASMPGSSIAKVKLAFGLTLTLRGIPELYYGDEIAMPGGDDPDNRRDFPGGWHGDQKSAFTAQGRTPEQQEVFAYVQKLLRLRRDHEALRSGRLWHLSSDDTSYVFLRETEEEQLVIAFHNGTQPRELNILLRDTPAQGAAGAAVLLGDAQADVSARTLHLHVPAQSLSVFVLQ